MLDMVVHETRRLRPIRRIRKCKAPLRRKCTKTGCKSKEGRRRSRRLREESEESEELGTRVYKATTEDGRIFRLFDGMLTKVAKGQLASEYGLT